MARGLIRGWLVEEVPDHPERGYAIYGLKPILDCVLGTDRLAYYPRPRDPLVLRHLCAENIAKAFGGPIPPIGKKPRRITLAGELLKDTSP